MHRIRLEQMFEMVAAYLEKMHRQNTLASTFDRSRVINRFDYLGDEPFLQALLGKMEAAGRIRTMARGIGHPNFGPKLSANEQKLMEDLVERFLQAGLQPPSVKKIQQQVTKNQKVVPQLVALAASDGQLVEIGSDFFLHCDVEKRAKQILRAEMSLDQAFTLSQIREFLGTSRKYAVPLCEYLDRIGFTLREGDLRRLAQPATM